MVTYKQQTLPLALSISWALSAAACASAPATPAAPSSTPSDESPAISASLSDASEETPPPVVRGRAIEFEGESFLLSDFEDQTLGHTLGGKWMDSFDSHQLGTTLDPHPLKVGDGGAQDSEHSLGIRGHFGRNVEPWPYADVRAAFEPTDLSPFSSVRFWVKGNNKKYVLALVRDAVADYSHYRAEFVATSEWTQIELTLDSFEQPNWGKAIEKNWQDVTALSFQPSPTLSDEAYEIVVDNIELVRAPTANEAEEASSPE